MAMDAFSASLMKDKREIVIAPTIYKFDTFGAFAEEFKLGERDVVLTNEFIYKPFMEELGLKSKFVFQEKFGAGEPSEAMIETMYEAIPYDSYDRVIAVGGGAIMDLCKLLGCKRPTSVHELYFKREPVVHEKEVIAIPTTCGTGSEVTNISVAIVKDEKDGKLTGGDTKLGLVSDDIIPNKVCLVPDLLKTLPYKPFAASAIDALIHATESFLSPHRKTVTSEMFSVKAMEMILEGFRRIALEGPDARMEGWLRNRTRHVLPARRHLSRSARRVQLRSVRQDPRDVRRVRAGWRAGQVQGNRCSLPGLHQGRRSAHPERNPGEGSAPEAAA